MRTRNNWRSRNPTLSNVLGAAIAVLLVGVWVPGMLRDDMVVPTWAGTKHPYHFHGATAWLMFAGFVCLGASVVVVISRRLKAEPDEKTDRRLAQSMAIAGAFIILAMILLKSMGLV
jgi:hypothetical protein